MLLKDINIEDFSEFIKKYEFDEDITIEDFKKILKEEWSKNI